MISRAWASLKKTRVHLRHSASQHPPLSQPLSLLDKILEISSFPLECSSCPAETPRPTSALEPGINRPSSPLPQTFYKCLVFQTVNNQVVSVDAKMFNKQVVSVDAKMFNNHCHLATPPNSATTCKTGVQFCPKLTIVLATSTLALTKVASGQDWFSLETLPMAFSAP